MRKLLRRIRGSRRGSVLAVVVVFIPATLGTMALAIDLSMLHQARIQAQRAADAAALAGASAYLEFTPTANAVTPAEERAREYAGYHDIRGTMIDAVNEVYVEVRPTDWEVYVHVRRDGIPTWFARLLGFPTGDVSADATAQASPASAGKCVKPIAIPDIWHETTQDGPLTKIWEPGEDWTFDFEEGDRYRRWNPDSVGIGEEMTGYGSNYRNDIDGVTNDRGRPLYVKPQNPQQAPTSGFFYPFRIGDNSGAQDYQDSLTGCAEEEVPLFEDVELEMGNMVGPSRQAFTEVFDADPTAYWDPSGEGQVRRPGCESDGCSWVDSPRVLMFALFDPAQIADLHGNTGTGGPHTLQFNNFAYFFLEARPEGNDPIQGRFVQFASGSEFGPGPGGTLVRVLRLVE